VKENALYIQKWKKNCRKKVGEGAAGKKIAIALLLLPHFFCFACEGDRRGKLHTKLLVVKYRSLNFI
jgi:hypothetical protein